MTNPDSTLTWAQGFREHVDQIHAERPLPAAHIEFLRALADFCGRHNLALVDGATADLWGFGTVDVLAETTDGTGWWVQLHELVDPTGIPYPQLLQLWQEDHAEHDGSDTDSYTWTYDGDTSTCHVVTGMFAFRAFQRSPWSHEFTTNMYATMRRALVNSGLADHLAAVPTVQLTEDDHGDGVAIPTGRTLADTITANLPTADTARHQAFAGPLGALPPENGATDQ